MPIRDNEQFCSHFLGESKKEAESLLKAFDNDLTFLANKVASLTGLDKNDLKQEGIIGLARARREFEEGRGAAFRTFALYKMKDAMREWVTKSGNVRTPQYLRDAAKLVGALQKTLSKGTRLPEYLSYADIWKAAKAFTLDSPISADVKKICESIDNLASRSHTTPIDLLDRAEITPEETDVFESIDVNAEAPDHSETRIIERMSAKAAVKELRKLLTPQEYELIYSVYVEGKTERELEKEIGIKASSIDVRLGNILAKIRHNSERILNGTNKEIEAGRGAGETGANN